MNATSRKTIMIAEDDPGITDAIQMMLEMEGYNTQHTINGNTLLTLKNDLPDVILLDMWMAESDGLEICKSLKKDEKLRHIPIIMVSARQGAAELAKEAGADAFIAKPFEMDELISTVKKYSEK